MGIRVPVYATRQASDDRGKERACPGRGSGPEFPAFDKEVEGISEETMADHYELYEGYASAASC